MAVVGLQAGGPGLHRQLLGLPGPVGGAVLGHGALDLDVPQLGVRDQHAVVDHRRADPGAEGGQEHQPATAGGSAVLHLGEAGGVGVVDHVDLATGGLAEDPVGVGAEPGVVDVGGRVDHAVAHDAGDGDADRAGRLREVPEELDEHLRHRVGGRGLGSADAHALGGEVAAREVHGCALDARAAEVDAEGETHRGPSQRLTPPLARLPGAAPLGSSRGGWRGFVGGA